VSTIPKKQVIIPDKKEQKIRMFANLLHINTSKSVSRVLSWTAICLGCASPRTSCHLIGTAGPAIVLNRVLLRIEFTGASCYHEVRWALTPPFHPYRAKARRYFSVALVLKLPSADVIRYPALWSPDFPRIRPFGHLYTRLFGLLALLLYKRVGHLSRNGKFCL